jgi:hypothetical protein
VEATLYQTRGGALSAREVALLPSVVIGLPLCREARDDGRTAVVPPGDFETAIARDKSGAPRCATGLTSPRRRKFASPHRSRRSGRGGPRASTHCCRFSTCGVSTGDFQEALAALLGKDAPNLSPASRVVSRSFKQPL